jgi:hypothetical protein
MSKQTAPNAKRVAADLQLSIKIFETDRELQICHIINSSTYRADFLHTLEIYFSTFQKLSNKYLLFPKSINILLPICISKLSPKP